MKNISIKRLRSYPRVLWVGLFMASLITVGLFISKKAYAHIVYPYEIENVTKEKYYKAPELPKSPKVLGVETSEMEIEEPVGPTVDPKEIKDMQQQVSDLLREIKKFKSQAQKNKLTDVLEELNALDTKLREIQSKLKTVPLEEARDVLDEFYQERYQEQLDPLRQKVELPNEIKNVFKQIGDLAREVKNLRKQAKTNKVGGMDEQLNTFEAKLGVIQSKIKETPLDDVREVLEEFYQENYWEQLNPIRAKIELPREFKEIERRLLESEKLINSKSVLKALEGLGIKVEAVKNKITEIRASYEAAKSMMTLGEFEDLEETLQPIRENHPGMISGTLNGVRDFWNRLRQVKDKEVQEAILGFLDPVVNAVNEGDYQELMYIQKEIGPQLDRLLNKAMQANLRGKTKSNFLENLEKLEALIEGKLNERETQEQRESAPPSVPEKAPLPEVSPPPSPTPTPTPTPSPAATEGGAG